MRKIFVDCGANVGRVLVDFMKEYPEHSFYAFEPNPDLITDIHDEIKRAGEDDRVQVLQSAVWTRDGHIDLFLGHHVNSTVLPGKRVRLGGEAKQINYFVPVPVPAVDFSAWLARTARPGDETIVKMDIEGAEYPVLTKMISDGTLDLISLLYIEWHFDRFPAMEKAEHDRLVEEVASRTEIRDWD